MKRERNETLLSSVPTNTGSFKTTATGDKEAGRQKCEERKKWNGTTNPLRWTASKNMRDRIQKQRRHLCHSYQHRLLLKTGKECKGETRNDTLLFHQAFHHTQLLTKTQDRMKKWDSLPRLPPQPDLDKNTGEKERERHESFLLSLPVQTAFDENTGKKKEMRQFAKPSNADSFWWKYMRAERNETVCKAF